MGKQMTVGKRIVLGFTVVILIAVALGGLGVWSMLTAKNNSTKLATEYVPEVKVATELRGASNRVMYEMRGYALTEEDKYYKAAQEEMTTVSKHLGEASDLANKAMYLQALKGQVTEATSAVDDYSKLMQETEKTIAAMAAQRTKLDENAASYMKNCQEFLDGQNEAFKRDLDERQQKVSMVTAIVDLGTDVRVANFKAQANADSQLMEKAIASLDDLKKYTNEIRTVTRQQVNIDQINEIEAAAADYGKTMQSYLQELRKGDSANAENMKTYQKGMDEAAGRYVTNCKAFLDSQQQALTKDMTERHEKISLVNDIIDLGNDARVNAFKSQALREPTFIENALKNFPKLDEKYAALRKITNLEVDLDRIDKTKTSGDNYASALTAFLSEWYKLQEVAKQREEAGRLVIEACKKTSEAGMDNTDQIATEAAASLSTSSTIMIIGLTIGTIIAIFSALWITRSITGPLNRIIAGLTEGSEQVSSASSQVSAASQSLAEGATEQAAGLEETSSSLEEMSSMTKQNADNAAQANNLSSEARRAADSGSESMNRMSGAINDIQKSSEETAKIIKVIDEIAFQTNLLALNAAVEAARAGEAGKGFAVVAEEVRNLAMRSAEAAKNTSSMIEESVKNSQNGVEISQEVAKALEEIVTGVGKATDLVGEIAAASQEQAQGIDQVNTAMAQMDKVTQQNAANAEESASASEELSAQAEQMNQVVAELAALVGGSSGGNGQAATSGNRGRKHLNINVSHLDKGHSPSDHAFHQIAEGKGKAAKKAIPLHADSGDGDFGEFNM